MKRKRFFATLHFARMMRSQGHTLRQLLLTIYQLAFTEGVTACGDDTKIATNIKDFWINRADHAE